MEGLAPSAAASEPAPTTDAPGRRGIGGREALFTALALAACSAPALWVGWGRFGDLFVDVGRELEWPRRILEGDLLYADLRFYYGPLAPYVNALLYGAFGVRLEVLACAGAVSGVAAALLVHAIAREFVGWALAFTTALAFLYVCAFQVGPDGPAIFNYVVPYTYAATYGSVAALGSAYALLRHVRPGGWGTGSFVVSAACLGITALAKLEVFLPALAAHVVFAVAAGVQRRLRRAHVLAWAGAGAGACLVYLRFLVAVGPALWSDHLGGVVNEGSLEFVRRVSGLLELPASLGRIGVSLLLVAVAAGAALGAARADALRFPGARAAAVGAAMLLAAFAGYVLAPDYPYLAAPPALAATVGFLALRYARHADARRALLPHLLLAVFALVSLARIPLHATPRHYGFYMLAPAMTWVGVALARYLPMLALERRRPVVAGILAALLAGSAAGAFLRTREGAAQRTVRYDLPRGTVWVHEGMRALEPLFERISRSSADARVAVIPQHSAIPFLLGRAGPEAGIPGYLPMELHGGYRDPLVVERLARAPPELVLVDTRILGEFGHAAIGRTYGVLLMQWVLANYAPIEQVRVRPAGRSQGQSGLVLLQRRTPRGESGP